MYEQHFGLSKSPFRSKASGKDVFVGPGVATSMAGIKKALSANDAIVTVSGTVGSGKTTHVAHALASISGSPVIIRIGRMRLKSEDVLELLLDELGVDDKPPGTIQRFAVMRRKLKALEENKTRVFVIIEDSVRLGADTLTEIETMTSADAGPSEGACVILMGDDGLHALLGESQLARTQQRVRQRFTIAPLSATEMHGYLRHCFRLVGGEFEKIFEANAAQLLHDLSGGIPRMCNNLVESAMTAAVDQNLHQVPSQLLVQIAENDYGLNVSNVDVAAPPEPLAQQDPEPEPSPLPEPTPVPEASAEPVTDVPVAEPAPETVAEEPAPEPAPEPVAEEPVPEPAPEPVAEEPVPEPAPEPVAEEPVPEPAELQLESESSPNEAPVENDQPVAELEPDLDALEQAMALAKGPDLETIDATDEGVKEPEANVAEDIPEITLDDSIDDRIKTEQAKITGDASSSASADSPTAEADAQPPGDVAPQKQNNLDEAELAQMAVDLSKAKSIEDIDDKLAETLFGEELNSIAAQFAVKPMPAEAPAQPTIAPETADAPGNDLVLELVTEPEQEAVTESPAEAPQVPQPADKPAAEAPKRTISSSKPVTSSQRLRTVRALNADSKPATPNAATGNRPPMSGQPNSPGSIEDQFATSVSDTQTQRVLNVVPPDDDDDKDEEETKRGFFSRFKRS